MTLERLVDRLALLADVRAIERDLLAYEYRCGHNGDIDDLWQRVQRVRLSVLTQLALFAAPDTEAVH